MTLLIFAASFGHAHVTRQLLELGADAAHTNEVFFHKAFTFRFERFYFQQHGLFTANALSSLFCNFLVKDGDNARDYASNLYESEILQILDSFTLAQDAGAQAPATDEAAAATFEVLAEMPLFDVKMTSHSPFFVT
jgi:hypothetical protein